MAEVAPAPVDPPAVKPKKKAAPKPVRDRTGPTIKDRIVKIVGESKDRKGISTASLKKKLASDGYDTEKNKARIRLALRSLVMKGVLSQCSGVGASGSFKLAKGAAEPRKKSKKSRSATVSKSPARKSAGKGKALKRAQSPKKAVTSAKKKASPKKKVTKKVVKAGAAAKKTTSVKNKKPAAPKSPKAKKVVPKKPVKKPAAKKTSKPGAKKTAAKK